MMRAIKLLGLLAFLSSFLVPVSAWAQGDSVVLRGGVEEYFIYGLPAGWQFGGEEINSHGRHAKWLPPGQSADNWTDLITVQVFPPLAQRAPDDFLRRMETHYQSICTAVLASEISIDELNGYSEAIRVFGCAQDAREGRDAGEIAIYRVVSGIEALYVFQRVYKVPPFSAEALPVTQDEISAGQDLLEVGILCFTDNANHPCPANWQPVLDSITREQLIAVFPAN